MVDSTLLLAVVSMQSNRFGNAEYISQFMQILIGFASNEDDEKDDDDFGDDIGNHMDEDNDDDKDHVVKKCGISSYFCDILLHIKEIICLQNK